MSTNLTTLKIKDTFDQLLHVDGGPASTEKTVHSGTGAPTALKVGTGSVAVDNIRLDENTISTTNANGNLVLAPDGAGAVVITKVTVGGGTISGITDLAVADGGTGASTEEGARANLGLGSMATQNADAVNITGGKIEGTDVSVPFGSVTARAYAAFSDITDQTGSISTATAVKLGTVEIAGAGITVVSDGANLTRITFATGGTYMVAPSLQLANSDAADHDATIWFSKNGTVLPRSATKVTVPKVGDGGAAYFQIVYYVTVANGDYVQVMWLPENAAITLDHTAAGAIAPAIPSAIVVAERIA